MPEYRKVRAQAGSFLSLCYTPELAAEVTLQPLRRFDMDAAIIFSDILVVPHAMGMHVEFVEAEGPKLSPLRSEKQIAALREDILEHLHPVAQAIASVRKQLPSQKALIGFCGAPWTVACYMVEGKSSRSWEEVRKFALSEKKLFSRLIGSIIDASCRYLGMQIEAGADIIQIFDSWAGLLSPEEYTDWVIEPTRKIVHAIKGNHPLVPVIGFPRGSGILLERYARETGVDAVSVDFQTPMEWAARTIAQTLQGNLDPMLLASDKDAAVKQTQRIIQHSRGKPFIFNLGHGIVPQTPIENVMAVCEAIRSAQ